MATQAIFGAQQTPLPAPMLDLDIADSFQELFKPARYKVYYSGRGAAKSWSFARALVMLAHTGRPCDCADSKRKTGAAECAVCAGTLRTAYRILCARELQNSIKDSVHRLIEDQINAMGLSQWFDVTQQSIRSTVTGSEFIFKGLRHNANEIKSMEAVDIVWVEEAQLVSKLSWDLLIPTIRKKGSEIWVSFNPIEDTDDTYKRFVVNSPPRSIVREVSWQQNPWFTEELEAERQYALATASPEDYAHIWEGKTRVIGDSVIFRNKCVVEAFITPTDPAPRFFHGADFGFSVDPAALVRCYVTKENAMPNPFQKGKMLPAGEHLWIDAEAFGYGVEQDDLPALYDTVPTARAWPIKADSSRPETISHVRRKGFNISGAEKWAGSVEDGIWHLKQFVLIHIHASCRHMQEELRMYRMKVDRVTQQVLPVIVDAWNHGWDAVRYALDGYIKRRGADAVWSKL